MSKQISVSLLFEMHTVPVFAMPGCFEYAEAVNRHLLAAFQVLLEQTSEFPFQKPFVKKKKSHYINIQYISYQSNTEKYFTSKNPKEQTDF